MDQPTTRKNARIDVADVLRGLAVMGIIVLHSIEHFNFGSYPDTSAQSAWLNFTDKAIWDGLFFMFGGKAYAVFALLFGFSFFIQDNNQQMKGKDFRLRFCWRLVLLFLFGNLNASFFTAEVLVLYSLVGFILVPTCRLSDKTILILACLLLIQPLPLYYTLRAAFDPTYTPLTIPTRELWMTTYQSQMNGTFLETLRTNLWEGQLASLAWAWDHGRVFQTAALFPLGMLAGRRRLFLQEALPIWNKICAGAIIAFFPLYGINNLLPQFIENRSILVPLSLIISSLANFAFMLMLVSGVLFMYYRTRMQSLLRKIIPYGKMSLTNYITQSIIGSFLFYHWGLGLHNHLTITASCLTGIVLFFLQWKCCDWWMKHHDHGPLEYLWKRATWLR